MRDQYVEDSVIDMRRLYKMMVWERWFSQTDNSHDLPNITLSPSMFEVI